MAPAMAKTDFKSVDDYIATFPKDVQTVLSTVRATIRKAVPQAEEVISYQLPAYKSNGFILYFGGFKEHYSLSCPPPFTVFSEFKEELARYEVSKSAIRFPLGEPVPVKLIADIAKSRAKELKERAEAAKPKAPRKKAR
jgi:uncharacterized protein YdhG (YjbR/CyaY superfamily)